MLNGYVTSNKNYILKIPIYIKGVGNAATSKRLADRLCYYKQTGPVAKSLRVPQALVVKGF